MLVDAEGPPAGNPPVSSISVSGNIMKSAQARPTTRISGIIKSTDASARTVTLETGRIYHSEARMDLSKFRTGDKVSVTYTEADGKLTTTDVTLKT
jgi:Cu/Ag efflux protein CusF